jgi:hypothetical protein
MLVLGLRLILALILMIVRVGMWLRRIYHAYVGASIDRMCLVYALPVVFGEYERQAKRVWLR